MTELDRRPAKSVARTSALPWLLFLGAVAVAAFLAWKIYTPENDGDALATGLVAVQKQNKLIVFSAQLAPVATNYDSRLFGLINSKQVAIIPARVDYSIDFSKVTRDRLTWDEQKQTLTVRLPPLVLGTPNLDEKKAQYLRDGIWITNDAQTKLTHDNTIKAERMALAAAKSPELLELAKAAGRHAVRANLELPLNAAGFTKAKVEVTFDK